MPVDFDKPCEEEKKTISHLFERYDHGEHTAVDKR